MGMGTRIIFLTLTVIFITVPSVISKEWADPPFLKGPPRVEVYFGDFLPGRGQLIKMDEEIQDDVIIAKFNYTGDQEPKIQRVYVGVERFLGAKIQKKKLPGDDKESWYIVITEPQDYETVSMQKYNIIVEIKEKTEMYETEIFLEINNIDDNDPVVVAPTCSVPELYLGLTNCTYTVTDADGYMSIGVMKFKIQGRDDEDKKFKIIEDRSETNGYNMKIHLETIQELDYDKSQIHIFTIIAKDSGNNTGEASAIVQVVDVPNLPPRWNNIFATQTFDEKTEQTFTVVAIDGDTGINKKIKYDLYKPANYTFFHIGEDTGILKVDPIDRDALKEEVLKFDITAYKFDNRTWETRFTVVIIIKDINDNSPEFSNSSYSLSIDEETYMSLEFTPFIIVNDIDLGENAQYTVDLESVSPPEAADAFLIIPNEGYQEQEFKITIVNASKLDYDTIEWQTVTFKVHATEKMLPEEHIGTATITINLINWNDEEPIFKEQQYEVELLETVGKGEKVITVVASDRDIGDKVVHSLVGSAVNYFHINEDTGEITVKDDDLFDYHRQSELVVQVKAVDTLFNPPYHVKYAQLTVKLIDVNNKQPTIRMPKTTPRVDENVPAGHLITDEIFGEDVDLNADIIFSIDWSTSYATKQGRSVEEKKYKNCVDLLTVYPNEAIRGVANGHLVAREIAPNVTIDFEEFEVLYLTVKLTDRNQEIGDDFSEGTLTLIITDLNDNAPTWVDDTLKVDRVVREASETGVVIGSVLAQDIDGPLFNHITYLIKARNGTASGLVSIGSQSGQIQVLTNRAIDADTDKIYFLYYTVTATDCPQDDPDETLCWNTPGDIEISVIDTNNKVPFTLNGEFNSTISIYENATDEEIVIIKGWDFDRDDIYNKITYLINYKEHATLRNLFSVNENTGLVYVDLKEGEELDRDNGVTSHIIYLTLQDNYLPVGDRNSNSNTTEITVILLDVNDHAPELPPPDTYSWKLSEDSKKGFELSPEVEAPDKDEEDTDNSRVRYDVLNLTSTSQNTNKCEKLFEILSLNNVTGKLITKKDLKGCWGSYDILIQAYDLGHPPQSSNETYKITVDPFNYETPKFTYPVDNQEIQLAKEYASNGDLYYTNKSVFHNIHAEDTDGLDAGVVQFEIEGPDEMKEYFTIENLIDNRGKLSLLKAIKEEVTKTELQIRATDKGTVPGKLSSTVTFSFKFLATTGDPFFDENRTTVNFTELSTGMDESRQLIKAEDPKNIPCPDCFEIFYYILEEDAKMIFKIDKENLLNLIKPLDRNEAIQHVFRIAASNSNIGPESISNPRSILTVTVDVKELNPRPKFYPLLYTGGITITDIIGKTMFQLKATHSEHLKITYDIMFETMQCDATLDGVKDKAFTLDPNTGVMKQNFEPKSFMKGMFEFNVSATDTADETDFAEVKIFLISDENRISFTFDNIDTDVQQGTVFIADTFTKYFAFKCNIDYVLKANEAGVALENQTEVRTHFIENDLAINASMIEVKKSDTTMMRLLREELRTQKYYLEDIQTGNTNNEKSLEKMLQIVLIVVSTVLGTLCIVLLVVYCMRTRSLNRRLKALSTVRFGSQDSGLNRMGVAVPGTNKHALEGSNPVWNEAMKSPEFDAISNISGDSDLIGVENSPQFAYDNSGYSKDKPKSPPNLRRVTVYGINEHGA